MALENQKVEVTDDGIFIPFSSYFDSEDLDVFQEFSMGKKRNFKNISESIADSLNLFTNDGEFLMAYLEAKITFLDEDTEITVDEVPEIINKIFVPSVVDSIISHVKKEYTENEIDIDSKDTTTKKNEELQFTNEHAEIILQWSLATILTTPLITSFLNRVDLDSNQTSDLIMHVFCKVLSNFQPEGVDILAKIHKLAESRVLQTQYSDKVIWMYLRNIAVDTNILIIKVKKKFICEGIPKLKQGTNIINFLHAFLKNQIAFQFTAKFIVSFKAISPISKSNDDVSPIDSLENEMIRQDEGLAALNEITVLNSMRKLVKELNYIPTTEEINLTMRKFNTGKINSWQDTLISIFYLPRFSDIRLVKTRNLEEFSIMYLLLKKWLEENNFRIVLNYFTAELIQQDVKKLQTKRRFIAEFIQSIAFTRLIESYFVESSETIVNSEVILGIIAGVYTGRFSDDRGDEVVYPVDDTAQEILRLIEHIINVRC